jgi:2-polyprenyl-6-methoxyphenol hydroxylase-like FAD-dependent oxidoreductase
LKAAGFQPTLVESAPGLRTGGYVIDFWGLGYEIAERMGLASEINTIGYHVREMRIVNNLGKRVTGFGTKVFEQLTNGRYVTVGRSDLSRVLFDKLQGKTEVIFDSPLNDIVSNSTKISPETTATTSPIQATPRTCLRTSAFASGAAREAGSATKPRNIRAPANVAEAAK